MSPELQFCSSAVLQRRKEASGPRPTLARSISEQRAAALEIVLRRKGEMPETFVHDFIEHAEEKWITDNGARMVVRAWVDLSFRKRLLADGTTVAKEMGFDFPEHHRQLVVLENAAAVHNVIVCTLCSCTAYTIIGAAPTGTRTWITAPE